MLAHTRIKPGLLVLSLWASALSAQAAQGDPLVGSWKADDANGVSSIIEIFPDGETLTGRIVKTTDAQGNELDFVCEYCPGELKGKPVKGMTFIRNLRKSGTKWVGGQVVDLRPGLTQGATASCELSYVNGHAVLFGYLGIRLLGQERVWQRARPPQ